MDNLLEAMKINNKILDAQNRLISLLEDDVRKRDQIIIIQKDLIHILMDKNNVNSLKEMYEKSIKAVNELMEGTEK